MSPAETPRFAALGHQENWQQISSILGAMRPAGSKPPTIDELRTIIPWIPPRTVSRFSIAAAPDARQRLGAVYVDTFISPDELRCRPTRRVLGKVQDAIIAAEREGVAVIALGGFTSILLESDTLGFHSRVPMTTGNSLTAALIIRGVERATALLGRNLASEAVLVIGATGDVGSACARVLNGRVRRLLLAARNQHRLEREAAALAPLGSVECSTDVATLLAGATVVIAVASAPEATFDLAGCRDDVIVCDAGYPKNIAAAHSELSGRRLFWGGMGVLTGGLTSADGILEQFYRFPLTDVAHGCMLEGVVLALAGRFESFSRGRGRISTAKVEEIWGMAQQQGVRLAPLFDSRGVWPEEQVAR